MKRFIPLPMVYIYHWFMALCAALWYRFPSRRLMVIGITGTNGKSTVVDLTHKIFEKAGFRVASVSSLRFIIADREWKNDLKMTMPGRFFLQRFLRNAVRKRCDVAILEITSEGIRQSRHAFIQFDVAALTNVTPEHIESHGSFENYRDAKLKLFRALARSPKRAKAIIINGDDPSAKLFLRYQRAEAWMYGLRHDHWEEFRNRVEPQSFAARDSGISFVYNSVEFSLKLLGEFNLYNALAAFSVALSRGIDPKIVREAFESVEGVPGRLEFITRPPATAFSVVVDYAHTPDALSQVYKTLKRPGRRLVCVLGATGGGRDRWKRPEMGTIADEYCDEIYLTNEDPYDENPEDIIAAVAKGVLKKKPNSILDRKVAIRRAIEQAGPEDVVIITGKGAEPLMMVARSKRIPWDDREVVRAILKR